MEGMVPSHHLGNVGSCLLDSDAKWQCCCWKKRGLSSDAKAKLEIGDSVPLSVAEIRRLLWRLLWQPQLNGQYWLSWSAWRRRHQGIAQFYHCQRRAMVVHLRGLIVFNSININSAFTITEIGYFLYKNILLAIPFFISEDSTNAYNKSVIELYS